jgi:hypothetical protein
MRVLTVVLTGCQRGANGGVRTHPPYPPCALARAHTVSTRAHALRARWGLSLEASFASQKKKWPSEAAANA